MADILPYLGVERVFSEDDLASKTVTVADMTAMTAAEAEKLLKEQGLTGVFSGTGEAVTGQIPTSGASVPGGSQVLLYLGEETPQRTVEVPDFTGMHRQQAADAAGALGLYILVTGNDEIAPNVVVTSQSVPAGQTVDVGSMIQLEFTDTGARD